MRRLWAPISAALTLAACAAQPTYTYGPASYATPPTMAPNYQPILIPLPAPPIAATPLAPPGQSTPDDPANRLTPLPDPYAAPQPLTPDVPPTPQAEPQVDPAPAADPPPSDPVTDLLLTPSSQRDTAPAVVKKPSPPESNPLMGFRPMRGQTAPSL